VNVTLVREPVDALALDRYFYRLMSLLVVVPVAYGFSFTVGKNLIHPAVPRPRILYLHAVVFTGCVKRCIAK